jgi:toluene monooxygenase electron transfer component
METYRISIAGGGGAAFAQTPCDASLLQAALRAGIGLTYECSSGGCGSCRIQVLSGEIQELWPEASGLSERDRRKGFKLACQTRAASDLEIKANLADHCIPQVAPRQGRLTLVATRDLTRDIREFRFQGSGPAGFLCGQYAMLALPDGLRRCYSMSNLPNAAGIWDFQIKRVPGGRFSEQVFALAPGSSLEIDGPFGLAHVAQTPRDVVCIAGGSGLAPMVSIARGIGLDEAQAQKQLHFFYGGRTAVDLCGVDYLADLPGWGDRIHYYPVVSSPDDPLSAGWQGETGFVHDVVARLLGPRLPDMEIYFAGPPPMAEALQRMLMIDLKVPFAQIHFDRFF